LGIEAATDERIYTDRKKTVIALIRVYPRESVADLGFDAVDAGGLDESRRQQPGTPVYATDFDPEGVRRDWRKPAKNANLIGERSEWASTFRFSL